MEDKCYFTKGCLCRLISVPALVIRGILFFLVWKGDAPSQEKFMPTSQIYAFKLIRGRQRTLPASVDSQLPSSQSHP